VLRALLSPRMLLLHVVAIIGIGGAGWLGLWQYGVWADHREDKAAELADADPEPLDRVLGPDDAFPADDVGRPVTLEGAWVFDETVSIAGKEWHGQTGYWIVTPLLLENGSAMPVVLGWSANADGWAPPGPEGAFDHVDVTGWLQPSEDDASPDDDPGDDVLPSLRISSLLQRSDTDLYSAFVIADQPRVQIFEAVTPDQLPEPDAFTSLRNLLYGIEWWVFGAFAVFLWWRWCADEVDRVRSVTSDADDGQDTDDAEVPSSA